MVYGIFVACLILVACLGVSSPSCCTCLLALARQGGWRQLFETCREGDRDGGGGGGGGNEVGRVDGGAGMCGSGQTRFKAAMQIIDLFQDVVLHQQEVSARPREHRKLQRPLLCLLAPLSCQVAM